jgi:hypothetical protein
VPYRVPPPFAGTAPHCTAEYCINERGYKIMQLWQEIPALAPLYTEFESGPCSWLPSPPSSRQIFHCAGERHHLNDIDVFSWPICLPGAFTSTRHPWYPCEAIHSW